MKQPNIIRSFAVTALGVSALAAPSALASTWCADHGGLTRLCIQTESDDLAEASDAVLIVGKGNNSKSCTLTKTGLDLWRGDCRIQQVISMDGKKLVQESYTPEFTVMPYENPETGDNDARLVFSGEPMPGFLPMFTLFIEN